MKHYFFRRKLPLFRPLVKRLERSEKEREKLHRSISDLRARLNEKDQQLGAFQAIIQNLENTSKPAGASHVPPIETPLNASSDDADRAGFAEVQVAAGQFERPRFEKFPYVGPFPWLDQPDAEGKITERLQAGVITEEEAAQFHCWRENGYIILERAIEPELLDEVWAAYEAAIADGTVQLQPESLGPDDPWPGRFQDPHMKVPALCRIMRHPTLLRWVRLFMEHEPAPFQTITSHKGSQQQEHSDSIHMTTYPIGYLTAAWVAFEDIHPDSGPLVYYPKSHRLPYIFSRDVGIAEEAHRQEGFQPYHEKYEPRIQQVIIEHQIEPHYFHAKKGDVLFWHANLLHGGSKRRDLQLSRRALVNHYFVEGAVCYHDFSASNPKQFSSTCLSETRPSSNGV